MVDLLIWNNHFGLNILHMIQEWFFLLMSLQDRFIMTILFDNTHAYPIGLWSGALLGLKSYWFLGWICLFVIRFDILLVGLIWVFLVGYLDGVLFLLCFDALDFVLYFLESFRYLTGLHIQRLLVLPVNKQISFCNTFIRFSRFYLLIIFRSLILGLYDLRLWVLYFIYGWFWLHLFLASYFCLYIPQFVQHLNYSLFIFLVVSLILLVRIRYLKLWIFRTINWFHRLVFKMILLIWSWCLISLNIFRLLSRGSALIFLSIKILFILQFDSQGTDKFGHFPVVFLYFSQI